MKQIHVFIKGEIRLLVYIVLPLLVAVALAAKASSADIAVVMSSNASLYQEALEGFKEVVRHQLVSIQTLPSQPEGWRDQLRKLRTVVEPDMVFAIGTSAFQAMATERTNIPIVHAMVFNPFDAVPDTTKNVIGIGMNPSAGQVISVLRELGPKYRRVGIMLDPSKSGPLVLQAQSVFEKEGLRLVLRHIRSAGEIGAALKSLENQTNVLWLWPDERFLTDEILQRIFLFSFARKIPVLGLSERQTAMGALLSLSYGSAKDLGRQAGEAVNRFLNDGRSTKMSHIIPRQLRLTVNFNTARKLDIAFPETIISRADNVVREPVYRNGDWWVFRIKIIDANGVTKTEIHRVLFKNSKFESDDPNFLTGGDVVGTPFFLPFASVYLTDPGRKWLDFPLIPGKRWSFRYSQRTGHHFVQGGFGSLGTVNAHAEVIGKPSHLIETPAGKFETIEIWRTEYVGDRADLTYFYSPQSQSVVRLRAEVFANNAQQFELELIAYGNGGTMGKDIR
jgi:putative ABC transport system substrate-binding protein